MKAAGGRWKPKKRPWWHWEPLEALEALKGLEAAEALEAFEGEQRKCLQLRRESEAMLRKLNDFLNVPESLRPILSFDLDQLVDPSRLGDLQASFQEVVTLNDTYRDLSQERLA